MSDPQMIREIQRAVSIPVMAKCRIGHFVEAQILQHLGVDFIDESEVLTPADDVHHINKWSFQVRTVQLYRFKVTLCWFRLLSFVDVEIWERRCAVFQKERP